MLCKSRSIFIINF